MNEEDNDVFSGSVTSQPQMVNVSSSTPMYMVERSSAPQVIGILVMIYYIICLLYTSPSPRDAHESRMPSSA